MMPQPVKDFCAWGMYPKVDAEIFSFRCQDELASILRATGPLIPLGNRRSYGDSALSETLVDVKANNYFLDFDSQTGLLHVQAGVLFSEILEAFANRGWFPPVTPGTKYVTVGGAVASDVHGKNHHMDGCFSQWVAEIVLMLPSGEVVSCSRNRNRELFLATCGGQGLTGVILEAKFYLKRICSTRLQQETVKTGSLKETFDAFEQHGKSPYSVAWIDCTARGRRAGRGIFTSASFLRQSGLCYKPRPHVPLPGRFPFGILNKAVLKGFNFMYYNRIKERHSYGQVDIDSFFYPLDAMLHWNRLYGRRGFVQYHFILPLKESFDGIEEVMAEIQQCNIYPYLGVLKLYGRENENYLSFPMEGYGLALDFKVQSGLFQLLERLDDIVMSRGGRLYLTKDARMKRKILVKGYPKFEQFRKVRRTIGADRKFHSMQSRRLGL